MNGSLFLGGRAFLMGTILFAAAVGNVSGEDGLGAGGGGVASDPGSNASIPPCAGGFIFDGQCVASNEVVGYIDLDPGETKIPAIYVVSDEAFQSWENNPEGPLVSVASIIPAFHSQAAAPGSVVAFRRYKYKIPIPNPDYRQCYWVVGRSSPYDISARWVAGKICFPYILRPPRWYGDSDRDGMPDWWEMGCGTYYDPWIRFFRDPGCGLNPRVNDAAGDVDNDGLSNLKEYWYHTNPGSSDTDHDGLNDGAEVNVWHTKPLVADTDGDGMPDGWEVSHGLDPRIPNTITNTEFLVHGSPQEYGVAVPMYGANHFPLGSVVQCSVPAIVEDPVGSESPYCRHVCAGWVGSFGSPSVMEGSGNSVNAPMGRAYQCTLTWLWRTEYFLSITNVMHGSVSVANGWYASNEVVTVRATTDEGWTCTGWTGDVISAINPLQVLMNGPKTISPVISRSQVKVVVCGSPGRFGSPEPFYGTNTFTWGDVVTNRVPGWVDVANGLRMVCTGWTGSGNIPAAGTGSTVVAPMLGTNQSVLTWLWKTNYSLSVTNFSNARLSITNGWFDPGTALDISVEPEPGYRFAGWVGDVAEVHRFDNPLQVVLDNPRTMIPSLVIPECTNAVISGVATYTGSSTGNVIVLAGLGEFDWGTNYCATAGTDGVFAISNVPTYQKYWIRAFVDGNGNGVMDDGVRYQGRQIFLTNNLARVDITLSGGDADGDGLPDEWEESNRGILGYRVVATNYNWIDKTELQNGHIENGTGRYASLYGTNGAPSSSGWLLEVQYRDHPTNTAGVVFPLYKETFTNLCMYVNGFINGERLPNMTNSQLAGVCSPKDMIAPYWASSHFVQQIFDALGSEMGFGYVPGATVFYWEGMGNANWTDRRDAYEAILYTNGVIKVQYRNVHTSGSSPVFGVKNTCGTSFTQWTNMWSVMDGLALCYVPEWGCAYRTNNPDSDGDGILDGDEDFDGDGLPNAWELHYDLDPRFANNVNGATGDPDQDGIDNLTEYRLGFSPRESDLVKDSDQDGYSNFLEWQYGSDSFNVTDVPQSRLIIKGLPYNVGTTVPAYGTNNVALFSSVALSVPFPSEVINGMRYVCTGWIGSGSVPVSGASSTFTVQLATNQSTLTWLWEPEYFLSVTGMLNGGVSVTNGWYASNTVATVLAVPDQWYSFVGWTGDVVSVSNPVSVVMDQPKELWPLFSRLPARLIVDGVPAQVGEPQPGYGVNDFCLGDVVTNTVQELVELPEGVRYNCQGWTGNGSVTAPGVGTECITQLATNESRLTWLWHTNACRLSVSQATNCTVDVTNAWCEFQTQATVTVIPNQDFCFAGWTGDLAFEHRFDNPLTLTMDRPKTVSPIIIPLGVATISGTISNMSTAPGAVMALACTNSSGWETNCLSVADMTGSYAISNVPIGKWYWIKAYVDVNSNVSLDEVSAHVSAQYVNNPVYLIQNATNVSITIVDLDSDGNGLPDWWEQKYFGNIGQDPLADPDHDGLSNHQEYLLGVNPLIAADGIALLADARHWLVAHWNLIYRTPLVFTNVPGSLADLQDMDAALAVVSTHFFKVKVGAK